MVTSITIAAAATTGTGDAGGYLTVADNSAFYPGAFAWLADAASANNRHCMITDLVGTTKIGIRFVPEGGSSGPSYGRSNLASPVSYASGSRLDQLAQTVRVNSMFSKLASSES